MPVRAERQQPEAWKMIFGKCSSSEEEVRQAQIWWTGHEADNHVDTDKQQTVCTGKMALLNEPLLSRKGDGERSSRNEQFKWGK